MTIGQMQNPTLNQLRYRWYQKRKHRRIPAIAESKEWVDQFWTKVFATSPPVTNGSLSPWSFTEKTGTKTYNAAGGFSGVGITYSLVSPPTGFSINPATGVITANSAITGFGSKSFTVRATNIAGAANQTLNVTIAVAAPVINGTLADWTEVQSTGNKTYDASVGFTGQSLTYSLPTGATGISINSTTGVLTANTATVSLGAHSLVVRATNASGSADQPLIMTIASGLTAPITVGTIGPWNTIQNSGNQTFNAASGFSGSGITYTLQVGATGFSINGSTGVVTANTATTGTGAKLLTVRATNGAGFADQPLTVNVAIAAPAAVGTLGPWDITNGTGNQTFTSAGGFSGASLTYSLVSPPTGFSVNSSTGVITANTAITTAGITSVTVRATNVSGFADQVIAVNIAIAAPAAVGSLSAWAVNFNSGNQNYTTSGGFSGSSLTYSLPTTITGLSINSATGQLTLDTTVWSTGPKNVVVRATNVSGSANQALTINISIVNIAAPTAIMTVEGRYYDPYNPSNQMVNGAAGAPGVGDPIGRLVSINGPGSTDWYIQQGVTASRPIVATKGSPARRGLQGDGSVLHMSRTDNTYGDWLTLPRTDTIFALLWLDAAVAAQVVPFCSTSNTSNVTFIRLLTFSNTTGIYPLVRWGTSTPAFCDTGQQFYPAAQIPIGSWFTIFVELAVTQCKLEGVGSGAGTVSCWLNDEAVVSHSVTPDRTNATDTTKSGRLWHGAGGDAATAARFWPGLVGRCGVIKRALTAAERASIKQWMLGTAFV